MSMRCDFLDVVGALSVVVAKSNAGLLEGRIEDVGNMGIK